MKDHDWPSAGERADTSAAEVLMRVAQMRRICHRLELMDLMGHVSARLPGTDAVAVSPGYGEGVPAPVLTQTEDVVVLSLEGRKLQGRFAPPIDVPMDLEIYRACHDVGAVLFGSPRDLVSFGIAGRPLLPITHHQSALVHEGIATLGEHPLIRTAERAAAVVSAMGGRHVAHVRGSGVVVVGRSLLEAALRLEVLEQIARTNRLALSLSDEPRIVTPEESALLSRELAEALERDASVGEGALDASRYFWSFDQNYPGTPAARESWTGRPGPVGDVRARVATACRVLDRRGTLVGYLEHVSHRIPGDEKRFAMSPAKRFAHMLPDDIGILAMDGDCVPIEGPYAPAPFRRYHRDLLAARRDVNAIVHTHEMYGRALVAAGRSPRSIYRVGGVRAAERFRVTATPNLGMSEGSRRDNARLLEDGAILHIRAHGTDFLGVTIEESVVDAIQREQLCQMAILASQLGDPALLDESGLDELARFGPSYEDWWRYYLSDA